MVQLSHFINTKSETVATSFAMRSHNSFHLPHTHTPAGSNINSDNMRLPALRKAQQREASYRRCDSTDDPTID